MKYVALFTTMFAVFLTAYATTLEEVQASYTDGTKVYSFRYEGSRDSRIRIDIVKLPSGKFTINKVADADEKVIDRDYKRLSEMGTVISVPTNNHNKVTYIWRRHGSETPEIFSKFLKKPVTDNNSSAQRPVASSGSNAVSTKMPWQYKKTDIVRYVDSLTNSVVNASILDSTTSTTNSISIREQCKFEYGGYYIMSDGGKVSYREALNQGWAEDPVNDLQMKVFEDVTSDPNSLWTKRVMFEDHVLDIKQKVKRYAPSTPMTIN